jgi:hypothetical protein
MQKVEPIVDERKKLNVIQAHLPQVCSAASAKIQHLVGCQLLHQPGGACIGEWQLPLIQAAQRADPGAPAAGAHMHGSACPHRHTAAALDPVPLAVNKS